jgi:hypothetical protein
VVCKALYRLRRLFVAFHHVDIDVDAGSAARLRWALGSDLPESSRSPWFNGTVNQI